jgi:uncharacterized membrane protein
VTPSARSPRTGLQPHVLSTVAYLGGLISGIVVLVLEKEDTFVRFHALQSTLVFGAILVLHFVILGLPIVSGVAYFFFVPAVVVLWAWLMIKAFNGERYKVPYLGDIAEKYVGVQ